MTAAVAEAARQRWQPYEDLPGQSGTPPATRKGPAARWWTFSPPGDRTGHPQPGTPSRGPTPTPTSIPTTTTTSYYYLLTTNY